MVREMFDLLVRVYAKDRLPYISDSSHLESRLTLAKVVELNTDKRYYGIIFWRDERENLNGFDNFLTNMPRLWLYFRERGEEIGNVEFVERGNLSKKYKADNWLGRTG